jgi:hypothetical protein
MLTPFLVAVDGRVDLVSGRESPTCGLEGLG